MKSKSFTLIELLIVIAMLGIIASIAITMYTSKGSFEVRVDGGDRKSEYKMKYDVYVIVNFDDPTKKIKIDSQVLKKDLKELLNRHIDWAMKNVK